MAACVRGPVPCKWTGPRTHHGCDAAWIRIAAVIAGIQRPADHPRTSASATGLIAASTNTASSSGGYRELRYWRAAGTAGRVRMQEESLVLAVAENSGTARNHRRTLAVVMCLRCGPIGHGLTCRVAEAGPAGRRHVGGGSRESAVSSPSSGRRATACEAGLYGSASVLRHLKLIAVHHRSTSMI